MITFEELLGEYFFVRTLRKETKKRYRCAVDQFHHFTQKEANEITEDDVLSWRQALIQQQKSPVTWNHYVRHLKALYGFGINHGYLLREENPFKGVFLNIPKKRKKTLVESQISLAEMIMYEKIEEEKQSTAHRKLYPAWFWFTVILTFKYTGIRQRQLLNITLNDIDLEGCTIQLSVDGSKTHREYTVPIVKALKPYLAQLVEKARARKIKPEDQLFNVNKFSTAFKRDTMNEDQVQRFFQHLSKECAFRISTHRFRHTLATQLMKEPERNLHITKELLGHTDIKTTLEYVETDINMIRHCLENLF